METSLMKQENQVQTFDFFNPIQFETMQRVCTLFASSELVPKIYQIGNTPDSKNKAIANCMIAIETAQRIGASPLMVMQNMYIVYGQPAWSSKFLIATVNSCGRYNSLKYKWENLGKIKIPNTDKETDNWQCIAYTTEKGSNDVLESIPVSIEMAIREGWYTKNGSKWQTMPRLMLQYRTATFWTRAYAPELSMGLKTEDEAHDIGELTEYEDVTDKVVAEITTEANQEEIGIEDADVVERKENSQPEQKTDSGNGQAPKIKF